MAIVASPLEAFELGHELTLYCRKCTREVRYDGSDMLAAMTKAKAAGWVRDGEAFVCPKCPALVLREQ